jgi:AcrR family transcriptional regulator
MNLLNKARRLAAMKEAILRAAIRAFARAGYQGATMSDVAAEAGYTAPSLYTYFKSKEEILDDVLELLRTSVLQTFDQSLPPSLTFRQRLELLVQRQLELVDSERQLFLVFQQFQTLGAALPPRAAARCVQDFGAYMERLTRWLSESAGPGDLGPHTVEDAAYLLHGIGHSRFIRWMVSEARSAAQAPSGGAVIASISTSPTTRLSDDGPLIVDLFLHGIGGRPKDEKGAQ